MSSQLPNVLLIQVDQQRADCLGVAGHPVAQTPHLDRLAAEGVRFSHAFCPAPICMPARTSLMTGVYSTQHGAIVNAGVEGHRPIRPDLPMFSHTLKAAGYWLGYVGKWQVGVDGSPLEHGFDEYVSDKRYLPWRREQGLPPLPTHNGWFGAVDVGVTPAQSSLGWGADHTIRLLQEAAARNKPFFLRWDPIEPHLPNIPPEPFASLIQPEEIPPWPSFSDPLTGKPYIQHQQRRTWGLDGWSWGQWAPVVARYLGVITLIDHQVGRILAALDELGLAQNTLVIFTSDHGDLCGGHGMIDKHYVMYEDVVAVPLILRWPGRVPAGCTVDAFVTGALDLAVTFCRVAGAPPPSTFVGRDLLGIIDGQAQEQRDAIFAAYHGNQFGLYSQRMIRTRRWKYVWNATAEDELYDLQDDPAELVNRAWDPACRDELANLRARLVAWMDETSDPLLNGWTRRQLLEGRKI
jgi:arylsulfatase A-like enzyme